MHRFHPTLALFLGATLAWPAAALAQGATVYRCPGNVYTSSADISAKEAEAKGCKTIEGAPITVIQGQQPRPRPGTPVPEGVRPADSKVDPSQLFTVSAVLVTERASISSSICRSSRSLLLK